MFSRSICLNPDCPCHKEPAPKGEPDYHKRFRERLVREDGLLSISKYDEEDILAFIDGMVQLERQDAINDERFSIIEKVEGMMRHCPITAHIHDCEDCGYNQALDDLLSFLRADNGQV